MADLSSEISPAWYSGILTAEDHQAVDPYRARFLNQLRQMLAQRGAGAADGKTVPEAGALPWGEAGLESLW